MYILKNNRKIEKMKTIAKIILILAVAVYTTPVVYSQNTQTDQLIVPLSNPGKPFTLKASLLEGSIKVVSYEGKEVVIDISSTGAIGKNEAKETDKGMRRISSSGGYEVTAKENDNIVSVSTGFPGKAYNLSFKIPKDANVTLNIGTVNSGNIEVENVKGELEVTNVNGDIKLTNITGSVVCNTVSGEISTTFDAVNPQAPMAFSTLSGNINVTFPADLKANLKLKSDMGEVYTDFEIDIDKSLPKKQQTTERGVYKVKLEEWIYGKVNGGGPEIMMKNMSGNIYVKKGR